MRTWLTRLRAPGAAQALGFSCYAPEASAALEAWRAEDKAGGSRRAKLKANKGGGMSDEEALAAQQALFAAARARCYAEEGGGGGAQPPPAGAA